MLLITVVTPDSGVIAVVVMPDDGGWMFGDDDEPFPLMGGVTVTEGAESCG